MIPLSSEMKKKLAIGGAIAVALLVSFATGRFMTPDKVVTVEKERVVEKIVERTDERKVAELNEKIASLQSEVSDYKKNRHWTEHIVTRPDGTVEVTRTEDTVVTKTVTKVETVYVDREVKVIETKVVDRVVEKIVEVEKVKIVENAKAQWRLTPMVGIDAAGLVTRPGLSLSTNDLIYGAGAQRRIAGPIWAGAWGLSSGVGGVSVSLEF